MLALTVVSVDPATAFVFDLLPYDPLIEPYSNQAVVEMPFAFTLPFNVAVVVVTSVAASVVTVGALPPGVYWNDISLPSDFPELFSATIL